MLSMGKKNKMFIGTKTKRKIKKFSHSKNFNQVNSTLKGK